MSKGKATLTINWSEISARYSNDLAFFLLPLDVSTALLAMATRLGWETTYLDNVSRETIDTIREQAQDGLTDYMLLSDLITVLETTNSKLQCICDAINTGNIPPIPVPVPATTGFNLLEPVVMDNPATLELWEQGSGSPPYGNDWTEAQTLRCQIANAVIDGVKANMSDLLPVIRNNAVTLDIIAGIVKVLPFVTKTISAAWGISYDLLETLLIASEPAMETAIADIESNRTALVCALANQSDSTTANVATKDAINNISDPIANLFASVQLGSDPAVLNAIWGGVGVDFSALDATLTCPPNCPQASPNILLNPCVRVVTGWTVSQGSFTVNDPVIACGSKLTGTGQLFGTMQVTATEVNKQLRIYFEADSGDVPSSGFFGIRIKTAGNTILYEDFSSTYFLPTGTWESFWTPTAIDDYVVEFIKSTDAATETVILENMVVQLSP